jgi:Ca-activated chloride channel family protein
MDRLHRRIGAPVVTGHRLAAAGMSIVEETMSPRRLPDLYPGAPLVVTGRCTIAGEPSVTLTGLTREGDPWSTRLSGTVVDDPSLTTVWAKAHLRDLEDRYASGDTALEQQITETSLRFGVLCRFTAWLAVDTRVVADGQPEHRIIQPVEPVAGWDMLEEVGLGLQPVAMAAPMAPMMMAPGAMPSRSRGITGRSSRARGGAAMPARLGRPAPDLPLAGVAAEEAARVRAAAGAPLYERRELLADLGSRLAALLRQASGAGPLRDLVAELDGDRPLTVSREEFEQLWTRTLQVLDELAGTARSRPFWKR